MLFLLSPAKTLDYESPLPAPVIDVLRELPLARTAPSYSARAAELIEVLKTRDAQDIGALMDLSQELAELNVSRYRAWSRRATARNSRPAMWAFDGDVYDGLRASTMSTEDIAWAQDRVLMLSGLYGVLRPLDRLQPYRLEMGTPLPTSRGANLYAYWHDIVVRHLDRLQAPEAQPVVVNLASQEYFKVCEPRRESARELRARVVECVFEDRKDGQWKVIGFFAKRARGMMARHAIRVRAQVPGDLLNFADDGYAYARAASNPDRLVFRRKSPPGPRAS